MIVFSAREVSFVVGEHLQLAEEPAGRIAPADVVSLEQKALRLTWVRTASEACT